MAPPAHPPPEHPPPEDPLPEHPLPSPSPRAWRQVEAAPRAALEEGLTPADLQAVLLDIARRRAARMTPARLMRRWQEDRYVTPAAADPRQVSRVEARLWQLLPAEFAGIELSPVTPLGTCTAVAPGSQDRVISTVRGTEVVSDPTNVLALVAAARRRQQSQRKTSPVHLAACHTVLRAQPFDAPGLFQHFRLFALLTSARDSGSAATEAAMLVTHLRFWTAALADLIRGPRGPRGSRGPRGIPGRCATVSYTVFGSPPLAERIADTVLPALEPLPPAITVSEDPDRQHGRGYYERGAIKIYVDGQEIGDGGFTDWTAQLTSDAKERCFTSCLSTERLAALTREDARDAGTPDAGRRLAPPAGGQRKAGQALGQPPAEA